MVERIEHVNICGRPYIRILPNPYKILFHFVSSPVTSSCSKFIYKMFYYDNIFWIYNWAEWLGNVWGEDGKIIKQILVAEIRGKRSLGRPRTRWEDAVVMIKMQIETWWIQHMIGENVGHLWCQNWTLRSVNISIMMMYS